MKRKKTGMGTSISMKFIIAYFMTAVLMIISFSLLVFENQIDLIAENALLRSLRIGDEIQASIITDIQEDRESGQWYQDRMDNLMSKSHLNIRYLQFYNEQGKLIASSEAQVPSTAPPETMRALQKAITKRDFESMQFHHELNIDNRLVDLYIPQSIDSSDSNILKVGIYIEEIDRRMDFLFRQSGLLTIAVLLIHIGFAIFSYRSLINPLNSIIKVLNQISEGSYEVRFPEHRKDEFGVLTRKIEQMSASVNEVHLQAKNANPLTGLPGNIALEQEILNRISIGNSFCVLYCDLDNFKAYNDVYGFSKGDEVILYTRNSINKSLERSHVRNSFFGHEGGDDFVIICDYYDWEKIATFCTEIFDSGISDFYNEEDKRKGNITSKDRQGNIRTFPLISLSVAVVTNHYRKIHSFGQLIQYAAEMKKVVKGKEGSVFMIDRRTD